MRILVLSKRQYMGKDLLDDGYGRFHELPLELARAGHDVHGLCASYRPRPQGEVRLRRGEAQVDWLALNVRPWNPFSLRRWIAAARRLARELRPHVIWACSDSLHAALGAHLQRLSGIPCVVDLYDNFESYGANRIPGVTASLRAAVRAAAGVTCVSGALRDHVRERYRASGPALVLENGITADFAPKDRLECRRKLGLPVQARIVGTTGALDTERGVELLFAAFRQLAAQDARLRLLLAGRLAGGLRIPADERITYLGELPSAAVPDVIGAMDLFVVCNRRSAFGDYCFPQKLYEAIACGVPVLVADTRGVAERFRSAPRHLYEPGSLASLAAGMANLLAQPSLPAIQARSWRDHAAALESFLSQVAGAAHA